MDYVVLKKQVLKLGAVPAEHALKMGVDLKTWLGESLWSPCSCLLRNLKVCGVEMSQYCQVGPNCQGAQPSGWSTFAHPIDNVDNNKLHPEMIKSDQISASHRLESIMFLVSSFNLHLILILEPQRILISHSILEKSSNNHVLENHRKIIEKNFKTYQKHHVRSVSPLINPPRILD